MSEVEGDAVTAENVKAFEKRFEPIVKALAALVPDSPLPSVAVALQTFAAELVKVGADGASRALGREYAVAALQKVKAVSSAANLVDKTLAEVEEQLAQAGTAAEVQQNMAKKLVELARSVCKLVHDSQRRGYALVQVDGHRETVTLNSGDADRWLRHLAYVSGGLVLNASTLADVRATLEAEAIEAGDLVAVFQRVAGDETAIEIDLGGPSWESAHVTATSVTVGPHKEIFKRTPIMHELPYPAEGGRLTELRQLHAGLKGDDNWALVGSALVGIPRASGGYCILVVTGGHGTAKTSLLEMLVRTTDPNAVKLQQPPSTDRDLIAAVTQSRLLGIDNLSHISDELSDNLCRVSTGKGALTTRSLFTTADQYALEVRAPILLGSIADVVAGHEDLRDRALVATLPELTTKLPDGDVEKAFLEARPRLFGALLKALSIGLKNLPTTKVPSSYRMQDHLRWAVACAPALELKSEQIIKAHLANRDDGARVTIDSSVVGTMLYNLVATRVQVGGKPNPWKGTTEELLHELEAVAKPHQLHSKYWPSTVQAMRSRLVKLEPSLKRAGITVERDREGKASRRILTLTYTPPKPETEKPGDGETVGASSATSTAKISSDSGKTALADDADDALATSSSAGGMAAHPAASKPQPVPRWKVAKT